MRLFLTNHSELIIENNRTLAVTVIVEKCWETRAIAEMCLARSDGSAQRLYSMSTQILEERKGKIAVRLGIWDFGRFPRDYKILLGESPSETLRE